MSSLEPASPLPFDEAYARVVDGPGRSWCTACGVRHDVRAHHDPVAMDREAAIAVARGDVVNAVLWRARASSTRAGKVLR